MNLKKMTDEQCLTKFIKFLDDRVSIDTIFIQDPDSGVLTHQILKITCGEYATVSQPQPLEVPLTPATAQDVGATVN